ncbi:thermonuclease family protein [Amorphus coralli]|uniref:thermonuclease family protein n=1 Tax=Amorphus coralli TaxID=340680 RepID=UPI0003709882|nr:hypothetical protein [Amorphus coralli]
MAYTPGYTGRGPRRSDTVSRAIYALVVVGAAAASVLPLLLLDDTVFGPVVQKMKSLPLSAPEDEPQVPSDWGGVEPKRQGSVGYDPVDPAVGVDTAALEPERAVRDVSSNRITRSPDIAAPLQRLPSSVEPPPPLPPKPVRYHLVVVEDATTIDASGTVLTIGSVEGPTTFEACKEGSPVAWSCELRARTALRQLVRARAIECLAVDEETARLLSSPEAEDPEGQHGPKGPFEATCSVGGTDIAGWLVSQGWAKPAEGAPDRLKVLSWIAQEQKRGLWRPLPPTAQ